MGYTKRIDALNAIAQCIGGVGGHSGAHGELQAWQEIQSVGIGLSASIKAKLLFLWTGKFSGDNLLSDIDSTVITVVGKDFSTNYIPATSVATFSIPKNSIYKTADSDDFWHSGADLLQKNTAELVAQDLNRTIVKYDDSAPYHIRAIAILKNGENFISAEYDKLSKYFRLHHLYFGVSNDYGFLKDNRNT